jgi:uncharacterized protein YjiK
MKTRGDKFLVGLFVFGILFYLVTSQFSTDESAVLNKESTEKSPDTSVTTRYSLETKHGLDGNQPLKGYDFNSEPAARWKLPKRLREISGLAMTKDKRLLGHNDEKGIIYEIDYLNGTIIKSFGLGNQGKTIDGDFEGIAVVQDTFYMVTSTGDLYECLEGADGEIVPFKLYITGVGSQFEIEGLAYEPNQRTLLLMSKNPLNRQQKGKLTIYRWSIDTKQLAEDGHSVIPIRDCARYVKGKHFQPSGIEIRSGSGNYFIVAARQNAIAEITPKGHVVGVKQFNAKRHPQIEGITFASDNTLIVSDEGAGKKATLTLYPFIQ